MITAKEAANIVANYNLSTICTTKSVENAITSAAAYGNTFVVLDQHLIPHEVLSSLIDNGYHLEVYNGSTIVSWNACKDNRRIAEKKIDNNGTKLELHLTTNKINNNGTKLELTTNDLSNYYALISADEINNRYSDTVLETITASNVESWFTKYIYSNLDRFNNRISCGTRFIIKDGTYNARWVVVGADTELNKGDTPLTKPHLSLIPVINLGNGQMNSSSTSAGAYANSEMNTKTIAAIVKALQKVLGSHLLARRVKLANSTNGNHSNANAYYTVYANLMCERQIWGKSTYENEYDVGDDTEALPGFSKYKDKIYGSSTFWLRSVYGYDNFVSALSDGSVGSNYANYSRGVRPLITIG